MKRRIAHIVKLLGFAWGTVFTLTVPTDASPGGSASLAQLLYENARIQLETTLALQTNSDSLLFELMADADTLAAAGDWKGAREVLDTVFDLAGFTAAETGAEPATSAAELSIFPAARNTDDLFFDTYRPASSFQIETGIDYSLQEFETSFIENDSVLVDELQNPYFGMAYFQPLNWGRENVSLTHRLRLDNQYLYYNFYGISERRSGSRVRRLEFDGSYFRVQTAPESDFMDNRLAFYVGDFAAGKHRWYLNLQSRYKWYPAGDSLSGDIFSAGLSAHYEYAFDFSRSFYLHWAPGIYRESRALGTRYFQNRLSGYYRVLEGFHRFLEAGVETVYQRYDPSSDEASDTSTDGDRYFTLQPRLRLEWALAPWLGIDADLQWERKNDALANAIYPSYDRWYGEAVPKWLRDDLTSLGLGGFWEKQVHSTTEESDLAWAQQADFTDYGLVLKGEYLNLKGSMINAEYRLNWRNYPNAEASWFDTFYSNRLIHSISIFGWIPLTRHWQFQLFVNYDNDQDRDKEFNDSRNTFLTAGLIYKW